MFRRAGFNVRKGRYATHDDRWESDFRAKLEGVTVAFDAEGWNAHERVN